MKSIYKYSDYRAFLKDRYLDKKAADSRFSFQRFSKEAGINSPNYLKLVMDGDRNLTVSNIHQFAKALGLTESEVEFFETLVLLTQSTNAAEKKYYRSRLLRLKNGRIERQGQVKIKNLAEFPYLPAILVSADGLTLDVAEQKISSRFNLKREQVEKVLQTLLKEKILELRESRLKLTNDYFVQYDRLRASADQKQFLKAQLALSSRALENRYSSDAQFFAHTFTTSPDRVAGMVQKFADLLEAVTEESSEDPPENAMQINIQFFPLEGPRQDTQP